ERLADRAELRAGTADGGQRGSRPGPAVGESHRRPAAALSARPRFSAAAGIAPGTGVVRADAAADRETGRCGAASAVVAHAAGGGTHEFAVSAGVTDSRLERLDEAGLEPFLGTLTPKMLRFSGESIDVATEGTELWRYAALVLIGLVLLESVLAPWVGRAR